MAEIRDPENTLVIALKGGGEVVVEMLPDVAPRHVERIKALARESGVDIVVHPFDNLLIHCAAEVGADVIIRGLRAVSDFEYEFQMVGMNRAMNDDIETVFLMADAHYQAIASRLVKEIARLGGDITGFVPPRVAKALAERFRTAAARVGA